MMALVKMPRCGTKVKKGDLVSDGPVSLGCTHYEQGSLIPTGITDTDPNED